MFKILRKEHTEWEIKMSLDGHDWQIYGLPNSGGWCFINDRLVGYDFDTSIGLDYLEPPTKLERIKTWYRSWKLFLIYKFKEAKNNGRK